LPEGDGTGFPFRGLILVSAFVVVLGTLVLQGLTLRPLMRALRLVDDGSVAREIALARHRTAEAALAVLDGYDGRFAGALRAEYQVRLSDQAVDETPGDEKPSDETAGDKTGDAAPPSDADDDALALASRRRALAAERHELLTLRRRGVIGDDAFHAVEEELDWGHMYVEGRLERG
jgi:CPA1 family monovalent cation:H+ antiporter